MVKQILKCILVVSMITTSSAVYAQETTSEVSTPNTPAPTATASPTPVQSTQAAGDTVNQAAKDNKSNNSSGSAMSYLTGGLFITMGAMHISEGSSSQNYGLVAMGVMEVMMGILSMKQGKESGGKSGASGVTAGQSAGSGYDYANTDVLPLLEANDPNVKAVQGNLQKLKDMGILDSTGTKATVNGKTYKLSDFESKQAAMAAGFPGGAWDGAMDLGAKAAAAAADKVEKLGIGSRTAANGFEEGGGGGGGIAAADVLYGDGSEAGYGMGAGAGSAGVGLNRDPSSLAGMQKNYNGDPIGVAADSIFLMMTRRYKVKESQESFYTDADLALKK